LRTKAEAFLFSMGGGVLRNELKKKISNDKKPFPSSGNYLIYLEPEDDDEEEDEAEEEEGMEGAISFQIAAD